MAIREDSPDKRKLIENWLSEVLPDHTEPVFVWSRDSVCLTPEARELLGRKPAGGMFLYILLLVQGSMAGPIPVYVGKAHDPLGRWEGGHIPGLTGALRGAHGLYARWLERMSAWEGTYEILVLHESDVKQAPIPGFPPTVGAVEYQLIALSDDAFPGMLLNNEGVAR